jgi:hypothetical protein
MCLDFLNIPSKGFFFGICINRKGFSNFYCQTGSTNIAQLLFKYQAAAAAVAGKY